MTDAQASETKQQTAHETPPTLTDAVPPNKPESGKPVPDDGLIPLGPPVFGKFAFFITVVPFIFYLAGNMFAGYIEKSRAHTQTNRQSKICREAIARLDARFDEEYVGNDAAKAEARNILNMVAINDLISEEEWEVEKLDEILQPMLDESIKPNYFQKVELRRQLKMLARLKHLEEDHKFRDVFALAHRHFEDLLNNTQTVDETTDLAEIRADGATSNEWFPPDKTWYPTTYTIIIAGTAILMMLAFPGYFKTKFSVSWWGVIVGVVGIVVWIGLIEIDRRLIHLGDYLSHGREAFNPLDELKGNPTWMWQFMAIRFTGLVLIVPFIEEFFVRGWLMRYIDDPDWDQIPIGAAGQWAILGVVGYGVMSHIGEPLAAAAWFGMVTWLYLKTKSIWDCVVAHAVTNLLLGLFVVWTGSWYLW